MSCLCHASVHFQLATTKAPHQNGRKQTRFLSGINTSGPLCRRNLKKRGGADFLWCFGCRGLVHNCCGSYINIQLYCSTGYMYLSALLGFVVVVGLGLFYYSFFRSTFSKKSSPFSSRVQVLLLFKLLFKKVGAELTLKPLTRLLSARAPWHPQGRSGAAEGHSRRPRCPGTRPSWSDPSASRT